MKVGRVKGWGLGLEGGKMEVEGRMGNKGRRSKERE